MAGDDVAAVAAAIGWIVAVTRFAAGWERWDVAAAVRQARGRATRSNAGQPSSKFATRKELKAKGLLSGKGVFLGIEPESRREISYDFVSELILAGPGAGKSTSCAAQILLRSALDGAQAESVFAVDVKMELFYVTASAHRAMGHEVLCICPYADDYNARFPGADPIVDAGFNPFGFITDRNTVDDMWMVCQLLVPEREGQNSDNDFFLSAGRELLTGLALLLWHRDGDVTLTGLRALLLSDPETFEAAVAEMMDSTAFHGELARFGNRIGATYTRSPKEWSGVFGTACDALQPFHADGALARSTSMRGVDLSTLKSGEKPVAVYFGVPPERIQNLSGYIALVISLAAELIARDKAHRRVTLLVDELQNISRMSTLLRSLALYRQHLRIVMLVQFLAALKRLYGDSYREFLGVDVVTLFGSTSDVETLETFSKLSGEATFNQHSVNSDPTLVTDLSTGFTTNMNQGRRPLLSVGELRTLGDREQVSLISNLPPVRSHRQSYLDNPRLRVRARHNPYYRRRGVWERLLKVFL
ncbi:type IV secretory system conjugative DNA transfer family protein [Engelhardtia mirabilis]